MPSLAGTEDRSCDYDPAAGRIGAQRVFADLAGNALWGAGKIVRFAADGSVARVLAIAARQPSCVAFGGAALGVLYATSALAGLTGAQPGEGGLFSAALDGVRGLPKMRFALRS